jgi:hypothetical protein
VNVHPNTEFRLSVTGSVFGLPPLTVVAHSGAWYVQTYWTPEQARDFAAQLTAMADEVESLL